MPSSSLKMQLAEAVAASLVAAGIDGLPAEIQATPFAEFQMPDLATMQCIVAPAPMGSSKLINRQTLERRFGVWVSLQVRTTHGSVTDYDSHESLTEAVQEHLATTVVIGEEGKFKLATGEDVEVNTATQSDDLRQKNTFSALLKAIYVYYG